LSENQEADIIKLHKEPVTDEEFALFMRALFGPYVGPSWSPE